MMNVTDFRIGDDFTMGEKRYRCTDIGTRTVAAIRIDAITIHRDGKEMQLTGAEAEMDGWFHGPPYAVLEIVMDEDDLPVCEPV